MNQRLGELVVADLHKQFPAPNEPLQVLRGISLRLASGEKLVIVGPSGSGKTTLLNILSTLETPTSGSVRLGNVDPFALNQDQRAQYRSRRIGLVFQDHHLLPQCTALENVLLPRLALANSAASGMERARQLLGQMQLESRLDHFPSELSGGERQRVAIARALMNDPDLLLCDEPTGNLDASSSRVVADLLHAVAAAQSAILIVVTHSLELAGTFGRRMLMNDGVLEGIR
jgi:lipoprotein-releasing system ATP-binding protein